MSEDELKQEAEEYAERHAFRIPYDGSNKFYDDVDYKASVEAYLAGAEPREKRIAELEKKLENLQKYLNTQHCYQECAETWHQLSIAKDLINQFLIQNPISDWLITKSENFLKESKS